MNNREYVYKYILDSVKNGQIDKESALKILKELNYDKKNTDNTNSGYAIIGMEGYFPKANSKEEYWDNIIYRRNCIDNFPLSRRKDTDGFFENQTKDMYSFYGKGGFLSEVDKFDAQFFKIPPNEAEYMDPVHRIFLDIAFKTFEDAGYGGRRMVGTNTGVFVGRDYTIESEYNRFYDHTDVLAATGSWASILVSRISYIFDLHGKCWVMDTACSSALVALHEACNALRNKECDMALVGGVNIFSVPRKDGRLNGIHSTDGIVRAFDNHATGTVWGEGCAAVLIKPFEKAVEDGDFIYSVIKGSAVNNDGTSNGLTSPNPDAQKSVMIEAWKRAGISPESLGYLEAHGTGTVVGDPIEIKSITKAMGKFTTKRQFCAIGTTKTMIGHLVGASGMAALFKVVMALQKKSIPAGINFEEPNEFIDFCNSPIYVNLKKRDWEAKETPRRAAINSFGIGGTNCHMVLEEFNTNTVTKSQEGQAFLLCISGKAKKTVKIMMKKHLLYLLENPEINLCDYTYTANTGRGHYEYRLAIVFHDYKHLIDKLQLILGMDHIETWNQRDFYYGETRENSRAMVSENNVTATKAETGSNDQIYDKEYYKALANLYISGKVNDFEPYYKTLGYRKISIPQYEMEKKRYWGKMDQNAFIDGNSNAQKSKAYEIYQIVWNKSINKEEKVVKDTGKYKLVISYADTKGDQIVNGICKQCNQMISVKFDYYDSKSEHQYTVSSMDKLILVLDTISLKNISDVIWISCGWNERISQWSGIADQINSINFMMFAKYLCKRVVDQNINLTAVTVDSVNIIGQTENINILDRTIYGLCKVISQENYHILTRYIDISYNNLLVNELANEIVNGFSDKFVALRNKDRFKEELTTFKTGKTIKNVWIQKGGVYVIAGGTGGIGLTVASYLAGINNVHLILLGSKNKSMEYLHREYIEVAEIEKSGTTIEYISVDLGDKKSIESMSKLVRCKYKHIDGIINCAGIAIADRIENLHVSDYERCVDIKAVGALMLGELFLEASFYILFSSLAAIIGGKKLGAYAAANACMSNISAYLQKNYSMNACVITIPAIADTGMLKNVTIEDRNQLFLSINKSRITEYLESLFAIIPGSDFVMGDINYDSSIDECLELFPIDISKDILNKIKQERKADEKEKTIDVVLTGKQEGLYTENERQIGNIYCAVLGYEEINIYSKLYELGADSIHAMKMVSMINSKLKIRITVTAVMNYASIYELANYLDTYIVSEENTQKRLTLQLTSKSELYPVSAAQKRMYILSEIEKMKTGYNITQAMKVKGILDKEKVRDTFKMIIKRHEALRTSFCFRDGIPVQIINNEDNIDFTYIEVEIEQVNQIMKEFVRLFNLEKDSLLRILLIHVGENENILAFDIHHIIADRISINIIMKEFIELYQEADLPEPCFQYRDYAAWHNKLLESHVMKEQEEYWLNRFETIPDLTLISNDSIMNSFIGNTINFKIEAGKVQRLKKLAQEHNGTLFMILLAIFQLELYLLSENEDIVVGCPVAGRNIPEVENMVGMFTNTLPIRSRIRKEESFSHFLNQVIANSMEAFNYQEYPFDELVHQLGIKRELGKNPIFNVLFLLHNVDFGNMDSGNLEFTEYELESDITRFDITMEVIEKNGIIHASLNYFTCKFTQDYMQRMAEDMEKLIDNILETPNMLISDLEVYKIKKQLNRKKIETGQVNLNVDFNF